MKSRCRMESSVKRFLWFIALVLPAIVAGCADKHGGLRTPLPKVTMTVPASTVTAGTFTLQPFSPTTRG